MWWRTRGGAIRDPMVKAYGDEDVSASDAVGFVPPELNGEGRKVQPDWFFSFLKNVEPIRPWLEVRMPTFGFEDQQAIDPGSPIFRASTTNSSRMRRLCISG